MLFETANSNIKFLPVKIAEKFPDLLFLTAASCDIKIIKAENFKSLWALKKLDLTNNQIENIESEVLEDLQSLEYLWLGEKIKNSTNKHS